MGVKAKGKNVMENFEIGNKTGNEKDDGTLNMSVSPICQKDGKKVAYVSFTDGKREAEGEIPACKIVRSIGFMPEEVEQLETYMKRELLTLKSMAAKINVFDAFLGRKQS